MNKAQKEVSQAFLNNEKRVLKKLAKNYEDALDEINTNIAMLMSRKDADMQYVIYQVEYQQALKAQVESILSQLHNNEFTTVSEYLTKCYEEGFVGTMYDLQKQGIPLLIPIQQEQVASAIQHETKLSASLYATLGKDVKKLSKQIAEEISRGIVNSIMYKDIAKNIADYAGISKNNAMRIVRTEGHRIQCKATSDMQKKAKERGADVVKIWDAALDSKTRDTHATLDGQIRELEEYYEVAGHKAMEPGGFGIASEDINCRCQSISKARWLLDADETRYIGDTDNMTDAQLNAIAKKLNLTPEELKQYKDEIVPVKAKDYDDFKRQYNQIWKYEGSDLQKEAEARIAGYKQAQKELVRTSVQKMNVENVVKSDRIVKKERTIVEDLDKELQNTLTKYTDGQYSQICDYSQYIVDKDSVNYSSVDWFENNILPGITEQQRKDAEKIMETINSQPISDLKLYRIENGINKAEKGNVLSFGVRSATRDNEFVDKVFSGNVEGFHEINNNGDFTEYRFLKSKSLDISSISVYKNQEEELIAGKYEVVKTEIIEAINGGRKEVLKPMKDVAENVEHFVSKSGKEMVKYSYDGKQMSDTIEKFESRTVSKYEYEKGQFGRKIVYLQVKE